MKNQQPAVQNVWNPIAGLLVSHISGELAGVEHSNADCAQWLRVDPPISKFTGVIDPSITRGMSGGLFRLAGALYPGDPNRSLREKSAAKSSGVNGTRIVYSEA